MFRLFLMGLALLCAGLAADAQTPGLQPILQQHREALAESSRRTIAPVIDAIADSGLPQAQAMLEAWINKDIWLRKSDGLFVVATRADDGSYVLRDIDTGAIIGRARKSDLVPQKPNSGVRAMIATALVRFQLSDPDPARRHAALDSIQRDPEAGLLDPLRASIPDEPDPEIRGRKQRLERLLTIGHDPDPAARIQAIEDMSDGLGLDLRAALIRFWRRRAEPRRGFQTTSTLPPS